ncbi:MAG: hypothetical protein ACJAW3_000623 [Lentimonas sp.]|jgi:hypothetical protein
MQNLARNPIIKVIGILLILYYGLLNIKKSPDSIGNKLTTDNIKNNFKEVSKKSVRILHDIKKAEELNSHSNN